MIEDQNVKLDGAWYLWRFDADESGAQTCWSWIDTRTGLTPSQSIIEHLNRRFMLECAPSIADSADQHERPRVAAIFLAMGGSREVVNKLLAPDSDVDVRSNDHGPAGTASPFNH